MDVNGQSTTLKPRLSSTDFAMACPEGILLMQCESFSASLAFVSGRVGERRREDRRYPADTNLTPRVLLGLQRQCDEGDGNACLPAGSIFLAPGSAEHNPVRAREDLALACRKGIAAACLLGAASIDGGW
jgi:hypothetical protein